MLLICHLTFVMTNIVEVASGPVAASLCHYLLYICAVSFNPDERVQSWDGWDRYQLLN